MGGFVKAVFDPAGIFGNWEDTPGSQPDTTPSTWNGPNGFMGGMLQPTLQGIQDYNKSQELFLPTAGADYNSPPPPREAPFQAQWQFTPGKGPQWLEPVDNGTTTRPKRQGDITVNETVDNGWSSRINNGPAKGNRI